METVRSIFLRLQEKLLSMIIWDSLSVLGKESLLQFGISIERVRASELISSRLRSSQLIIGLELQFRHHILDIAKRTYLSMLLPRPNHPGTYCSWLDDTGSKKKKYSKALHKRNVPILVGRSVTNGKLHVRTEQSPLEAIIESSCQWMAWRTDTWGNQTVEIAINSMRPLVRGGNRTLGRQSYIY
jgi:hypothetical protein